MLSKPQLIVFPTSRAIRSYIQKNKTKNKLLPFTITIDEFLKKSIILKGKLSYIDEEQRVLFLKEAIKDVNIKKLGISNNFSKFLKQHEYIYRFFLELSSENIELELLKNYDTYDYYFEHLEILEEIKNKYLVLLEENSLLDKINLSENFFINKSFLDKFESCNIVFEGYFTKQEFEIVKDAAKYININIKLVHNKYNKKSIEIFENFLDIKLDCDYTYEINLSKKELINHEKIETSNNIKDIKAFSSRINQIAFIKSTVANSVNDGNEPSSMALVLPDESFASLLELFDYENYFNYAMGKNIKNSFLYQVSNAISFYINEDEEKYIENLNYLKIEKKVIDEIIKPLWNKQINKDEFKTLINFIKKYEKNSELIDKYDELIYKLNILFFSNNVDIKLKDVYKIYLQKLASLSLDDINSGKVTVLGLLETRAVKFNTLIICDFNEDYIPKISIKDKFLSTKLKENVGLPNSIDRQNLQKYYYKRLIDNSENIYISYVNSEIKSISRFANELFHKKIDEKVYDNYYKEILFFNKNIKNIDLIIKEKINLSQYHWSATSLKTFLECKRKFYLHYIMKIEEHTLSLRPKAYELGNIVHEVLESYYKQENLDIGAMFNTYANKNSFLLLDLEIWKNKIEQFLEIDKRYLENKELIDLEKKFNVEFDEMKLKGVIDRIEKHGDTFNVIDYKTSSSLKVDSTKNFEKSNDFQLEFYYLALSEMFKTDKIKAYYYDLHNLKLLEEVALDEKLEKLIKIFDEIKTISKDEIVFDKCEEKSNCLYCPYKIVCNRE